MFDSDQIYKELSAFLSLPEVKAKVDEAKLAVLAKLETGLNSFSISITPNDIPDITFPIYGQLIRVYGAKPDTIAKVERHPNSFQTLTTINGSGKTKVFAPTNGFLEKIIDAQYWSFVPQDTWHQPIATAGNWVCVTFHSAPSEKLIDEYRN